MLYLFKLNSFKEIEPGKEITISEVCHQRCYVKSIRIPQKLAKKFKITDIRIGVEPLLLSVAESYVDEQSSSLSSAPSNLILEKLMDFSITICNINPKNSHFECEVWGSYPE